MGVETISTPISTHYQEELMTMMNSALSDQQLATHYLRGHGGYDRAVAMP